MTHDLGPPALGLRAARETPCTAALVDFRFLAHAVLPTDDVVGAMQQR
jgi:hypothetical protein